MAVVCDALSVLVRCVSLDEKFPRGTAGYRLSAPNATFCSDGQLTRIGFMQIEDGVRFEAMLEHEHGLVAGGGTSATREVVITDQARGVLTPCAWIEMAVIDGVPQAWTSGSDAGPLVGPDGWNPSDSSHLTFRTPSSMDQWPSTLRDGGSVARLDPTTGKMIFTTSPFTHRDVNLSAAVSVSMVAGLWDRHRRTGDQLASWDQKNKMLDEQVRFTAFGLQKSCQDRDRLLSVVGSVIGYAVRSERLLQRTPTKDIELDVSRFALPLIDSIDAEARGSASPGTSAMHAVELAMKSDLSDSRLVEEMLQLSARYLVTAALTSDQTALELILAWTL